MLFLVLKEVNYASLFSFSRRYFIYVLLLGRGCSAGIADIDIDNPLNVPVAARKNCSLIPLGSPSRSGVCSAPAAPAACVAHAGVLTTTFFNPFNVVVTPYTEAKNYKEFAYRDCITLNIAANVTCRPGAGSSKVCRCWDAHAGGLTMLPVCAAATLVGVGEQLVQQCTN